MFVYVCVCLVPPRSTQCFRLSTDSTHRPILPRLQNIPYKPNRSHFFSSSASVPAASLRAFPPPLCCRNAVSLCCRNAAETLFLSAVETLFLQLPELRPSNTPPQTAPRTAVDPPCPARPPSRTMKTLLRGGPLHGQPSTPRPARPPSRAGSNPPRFRSPLQRRERERERDSDERRAQTLLASARRCSGARFPAETGSPVLMLPSAGCSYPLPFAFHIPFRWIFILPSVRFA